MRPKILQEAVKGLSPGITQQMFPTPNVEDFPLTSQEFLDPEAHILIAMDHAILDFSIQERLDENLIRTL